MNISEFVKKYNVTVDLTRVPENPHMDDSWNMINYLATLQFENKSMRVYFSTGNRWIEDLKGNPVQGFKYDIPTGKVIPSPLWGKKTLTIYDVEEAERNYRIRKPSASDILDCLASDATGIENSSDFESWAEEYGYSTDSRSAERIYDVCKKQAKDFKRLLGLEVYTFLLFEVERE